MLNEDFIVVDNIHTRIVQAGTGKSLLLVHGLGASQMWQRVIEPLSRSFHVIAIDLPGFGESECPVIPLSIEQYAEFVVHLLDTLKLSSASVVGISYGGQIAANLTYRFPHRVENLVLITSTGLQKPRWFARNMIIWKPLSIIMKYAVLQNRIMLNALSKRSYYNIHNRPANLVENFRKQLFQLRRRDIWLNAVRCTLAPEQDFREKMATLRHRVLIVWGSHDRIVSVRVARELHRLISNSTLKIIPACAHSVPLEKPDEVCDAIKRFIY